MSMLVQWIPRALFSLFWEHIFWAHQKINIFSTSGTTGMPKAAVKNQLQMCVTAMVAPKMLNLNDDSRLQMDLPLFHFSGNLNCQTGLGAGSQLIISKKFSASKAVETLKKYQSTHMVYIGETLRFINQVNLIMREFPQSTG